MVEISLGAFQRLAKLAPGTALAAAEAGGPRRGKGPPRTCLVTLQFTAGKCTSRAHELECDSLMQEGTYNLTGMDK